MNDLRERMQKWPLQTAAAHAPYMLGMAFDAPLIGLLKRWPNKLHAVPMESVIDASLSGRAYESACGMRGLRLLGKEVDGQQIAARWPPRLRGLPDDLERCRECWDATGKMRPRTEWGGQQ